MELATELEFLKWFYQNCDFGPGDTDERWRLREQFVEKTGKGLPDGYEFETD